MSRRRCGCTATLLCVDCARLLARSEGRTALASGWTAAATSTQLQGRIVQHLTRLPYWLAYHTHDSRKSAPGFPDLVLLRAPPPAPTLVPRQIVAELRTRAGLPPRRNSAGSKRSGSRAVRCIFGGPMMSPRLSRSCGPTSCSSAPPPGSIASAFR